MEPPSNKSMSFSPLAVRRRTCPSPVFFRTQTPYALPYHRTSDHYQRPPFRCTASLTSKRRTPQKPSWSPVLAGLSINIFNFLFSCKTTCGGVTTLCCILLTLHAGFIRSSSGSPPSLPLPPPLPPADRPPRHHHQSSLEERQTSPLLRLPLPLLLLAVRTARLYTKIPHGHRRLSRASALSVRHHVLPHQTRHSGDPSRHLSKSHAIRTRFSLSRRRLLRPYYKIGRAQETSGYAKTCRRDCG